MAKYDDSSIKVLSDIEHIRKRSSMYLNTDRPSYQLVTEILDNAVDEGSNGYATEVHLDIDYNKGIVKIFDNGRGLPQGMNDALNKPTIEVIYSKLNAGGKYDQNSYATSGGLNGVGSTVVNALSSYLNVETWRGDATVKAQFQRGVKVSYEECSISRKGKNMKSGTSVEFCIDKEHKLFQSDNLSDYKKDIEDKMSLLKTLIPNVNFWYNGKELQVVPFTKFLQLSKDPLFKEGILLSTKTMSVALNWSKDTNRSTQRSYGNTVYNANGGDHEKAVYEGVVDALGTDDVLMGINIAVSIMYPGIEFDSQAKLKAISKEMRQYVREATKDTLKQYFKKYPKDKESILELAKSKRVELSKRNNKSAVRRDKKSTFLNALGATAFADCTTKDRSEAELFITEGNSAAGSARQARNVETQAVAPLRGKFINAYTADVASLLKNAEVGMLLSSIDCGMFDDVNVNKSRYGKIIIFSDADEDGKDIACLLISFFMKVLPDLVRHGYLYLSLPPLYGTHDKSGKFIPINSEEEREEYQSKGYTIQRYKGLGEMSPEQLKVSCMDPSTRKIVQITYSDNCEEYIEGIMGGDSSKRKQLLVDRGVLSI